MKKGMEKNVEPIVVNDGVQFTLQNLLQNKGRKINGQFCKGDNQ